MPVGKPDPEGDGVISAHRAYRGKTLGPLTTWDCPACGKKNDGRPPEQGCGHCGAGDPNKSRAGQPQETGPAVPRVVPRRPASQPVTHEEILGRKGPLDVPLQYTQLMGGPFKEVDPLRVLRLIEYRIKPGQDIKEVLRRSLVGTMEMAWGTLTGTIVDSIDPNQEDRLRLAKLQPGVWIANETAMAQAKMQDRRGGMAGEWTGPPLKTKAQADQEALTFFERVGKLTADHNALQESLMEKPQMPEAPPPMPDTGVAFSPVQFSQAQSILTIGGFRLCYTLALALQSIAQELEGNSEPEKFLSGEECLQLANALMQQVPPDWTGEQEEPSGQA